MPHAWSMMQSIVRNHLMELPFSSAAKTLSSLRAQVCHHCRCCIVGACCSAANCTFGLGCVIELLLPMHAAAWLLQSGAQPKQISDQVNN